MLQHVKRQNHHQFVCIFGPCNTIFVFSFNLDLDKGGVNGAMVCEACVVLRVILYLLSNLEILRQPPPCYTTALFIYH